MIGTSWQLHGQAVGKDVLATHGYRRTLHDALTPCPKCGATSGIEGPYISSTPGQAPVFKRTIRCPNAKGKHATCSVTVETMGPAPLEVEVPVLEPAERDRIKDGLKKAGVTASDFAERMGMHPASVYNALSCSKTVSEETKAKMFKTLEQIEAGSPPPVAPFGIEDPVPGKVVVHDEKEAVVQADPQGVTHLEALARIEASVARIQATLDARETVFSAVEECELIESQLETQLEQGLKTLQELAQLLTKSIQADIYREPQKPSSADPYSLAASIETQARELMRVDHTGHLLRAAIQRAITPVVTVSEGVTCE